MKYSIIFHRFGESVIYSTIFHRFGLRNQWNIGLYFIDSKYLEILSLHTTKRNLQRPGIEPGTYRLAIQHSTNELSRLLRNCVLQLHYKESMSIFRKLYNDITQKVLVLSKNSFYESSSFRSWIKFFDRTSGLAPTLLYNFCEFYVLYIKMITMTPCFKQVSLV